MLYLISYDLTREPPSEYEDLIAQLEEWGALRILYSEWLLPSDRRATEIRDALYPVLRAKDLIWVLEVTTNSGWRGCRDGNSDAAKAIFKHARPG
jgi:hypothetical protein